MALTAAQMLAIVTGGGATTYRLQLITQASQVPSDAQIANVAWSLTAYHN